MAENPLFAPLTTPVVRPLRWIGLALAALVAAIGAGFGFAQHAPTQYVIFTTAGTFTLALWLWNGFFVRWIAESALLSRAAAERAGRQASARTALRGFASGNKGVLAGLGILILGFIVLSLTLTGFLTWLNLFTALFLAASLVFTTIASRAFGDNRSAFIGLMVLGTIFVVASLHVEGFLSGRQHQVHAGLRRLPGLGHSRTDSCRGAWRPRPLDPVPDRFVECRVCSISSASEFPRRFAVILILVAGAAIGSLNGLLSFPLQGQALIVTLGVGFATSGLTQILTSIGSSYAGNVFGQVPAWLSNLAAMNGVTFGLRSLR